MLQTNKTNTSGVLILGTASQTLSEQTLSKLIYAFSAMSAGSVRFSMWAKIVMYPKSMGL